MSVDKPKRAAPGQQLESSDLFDEQVACPWCESKNTHVLSLFGGTVSEISMQCDDCKSTFGWMKWQGKLPGDE
jgi:ring-1,2-phenylacetyl-CoA epoxidase subunit PaaD